MSIGLFLGLAAQKHLEEINKTRATMGLKPMAIHEFLQNVPKGTGILNAEGKLNQKIIKHFATEARVESTAAKAALKSFPKGTFSGIVDDVAAKLAAPAAAAAVGLEALRRRRNKVAAKEAAMEARNNPPKINTSNPANTMLEDSAKTIGSRTKNLGKLLIDKGSLQFAAGIEGVNALSSNAQSYLENKQNEQIPALTVGRRMQDEYRQSPSTPFGQFTYDQPSSWQMEAAKAYGNAAITPKTWGDAAWEAMDSLTFGGLTRNQEYNRRSGMDGELSMGEQLMNFGKSAAAIPLDILSLGHYDYATLGPEFSPNLASMSESVNKITMSKEDEIRAATERMQTPSK
jgi:hypothetical protein